MSRPVYVGTPSVAESLERIAGSLEGIHATLRTNVSALDCVANTLEQVGTLVQENTPAKQMEWVMANLPELVAKAREVAGSMREQGPRVSPATRKFRYTAKKAHKPRRRAVAKRANTRQPSED